MLIISNRNTGQSESFPPTEAGYAEARAFIDAITGQGHIAEGDVSKVIAYTG